MPYAQRLNASGLCRSDLVDFRIEFDLLRAELDDIRTKYAATLAKLDVDVGVTDVNYGSLGALAAKRFTPT